ncbi:non-ribosomal peptide synthetase, partial [Pseudoalteromonas sp. BMB]|uniref:non-ribosomal peptide synthetase n=1 Tax=Pseudoalteromonas sp. BMB TaxID=1874619 RepID=UPI000B0E0C9D
AYVPLDPEYPEERLDYMLADCGTPIVVTQDVLLSRLSSLVKVQTRFITLDGQYAEISNCAISRYGDVIELQQCVRPNNLAYVIYTSGSTGKSKGVAVEHQGVVNMILSQIADLSIQQEDRLLQNFSICFDGAVYEMYLSLLSGATLVITPKEEKRDPIKFLNYLNYHRVTVATITPSYLAAIGEQRLPLRVIITAGEAANKHVLQYHLDNNLECINAYGPTETSVCATYYKMKDKDKKLHCVPIGKPINNTQIYILDEHENPVPIGVPGELHIAGDGLARGYLNREELTDGKFITNRFNPNHRLYKTGDLARWLEDGNIEFLGRVDTQVKIRGFRVEIGEIEAQLNLHPMVKDCAVVAQQDRGINKLVAFYVASQTTADSVTELSRDSMHSFLKSTLPDHMLPLAYMSLREIPQTPNGKVDRTALERLQVNLESSQAYIAPRNDVEAKLVVIWADVLDLDASQIGINDSFFELGGHSLIAVKLMAKVNSLFGQNLPLSTVFSNTSIGDFAELLKSHQEQGFNIVVPLQTHGKQRPIFAIPGAGGNVLSLQPIANVLNDSHPLYGLQPVGLDGKREPLDSVSEVARVNIAAMKQVQPEGPYHLIGHSYGGVVAYAMAQILLAGNEQVASLSLIDSIAPSVMQSREPLEEDSLLVGLCITLAKLYGVELQFDREQVMSISADDRIDFICQLFELHGVTLNADQFTTLYRVYKADIHGYLSYEPAKLTEKIKVTLYRATQTRSSNIPTDYGWSDLLVSPIRTSDLAADHHSILGQLTDVELLLGLGSQQEVLHEEADYSDTLLSE